MMLNVLLFTMYGIEIVILLCGMTYVQVALYYHNIGRRDGMFLGGKELKAIFWMPFIWFSYVTFETYDAYFQTFGLSMSTQWQTVVMEFISMIGTIITTYVLTLLIIKKDGSEVS